jgi:hypothetical protein
MNLRVLARGDARVLYPHQHLNGFLRYVGRETILANTVEELPADCTCVHIQANEFLEPGQKGLPHSAHPRKAEPVEVPCDAYFLKSIRRGDLWAADKPTAEIAGVKFDPTFGGEYPQLSKANKTASKVGE